ncbi:kinase-like domain-containing protein [Circinella umbellata]|nr:kinase-like domain-containing protein [Circinella umbellata]
MSDKIAVLEAKIAENKQGLAGTLLARSMLKDPNGIAHAEIQIAEYQRSLAYFTQELDKLQARKNPEIASTRANSIKRHYTNLELLTSETPYNKSKVSLKLHEIDYKTDVERKLLSGIKNLVEAINGPNNKVARRRQIEVNAEKEQSEQKLELLSRALRKYKQLHIEDDEEELGFDSVLSTELPPGIRQPVTGTLHLQIMQARNLEHVPTRTMRSPITITTAKIDGTVKYKSHPTRTDKWFENCKIPVNKGSELELEIHDESSDKRQLIGIIWIKVADIAEALRKQKVKDGQNDLGWVSAKIVRQQQNDSNPAHHLTDSNVSMTSTTTDSPSSASSTASSSIAALGGGGGSSPSSSSFIPAVPPNSTATSRTGSSTTTTDILYHRTSISKSDENGIMEWFDVEPYGELALRLNFVRENPTVTFPFAPKQNPILVRAGAVREKPAGERYEVNGHQFIEHRLYNIMKCAYCGDFLVKNGFRCDDCSYTCHGRCSGKVVTKCISKSSLDTNDLEEDRVNHRIPHRFIPITNIGANWCCHCGQVLSLGSRKARKCSECGITSHTTCAHLVPDFCGLSMEIANQMLAEIRAARDRPIPPPHRQSIQQPIHLTSNTKTAQTPTLFPRTDTIIGDNDSFDSMSVQASEGESIRPYSFSGPPQPTTATITECNNEETESNYNTSEMVSRLGISPIGGRREQQEQDDNTTVLGDNNNTRLEDPYLRIYEQLDHQLQGHYTETLMNDSHMYSQSGEIRRRRNVTLNDFTFKTVVGRGTFGKVILAYGNHDEKPYAIKVLKKKSMIDDDAIESIRLEKRVFQLVNRNPHPFLTRLHSSFQSENHLFFVMEYISGGDLMSHIQRETFSERRARFYASEVLLGLEHFHNLGIIYRDLKLENIMLGPDGHIKIGDYGMCKDDMWYGSRTNTMCGTPGFMAPEILLHQGYDRAVDWWAFGVLIYQMVFSRPPFPAEHDDEIYDATLNDEIVYPMKASAISISICEQLLNRDPSKRLGSGERDALEVKAHPFFSGVDWKGLLDKRISPPFIPTIKGPLDTSNFDEEFTQETPQITPIHSTITPASQQEFEGFSYTADWVTIDNNTLEQHHGSDPGMIPSSIRV